MVNFVTSKTIIKHLINGTLENTLCRICLKPFGEVCENIFTQFWFENKIFSIADILKSVCRAEFSDKDNYSVCADCVGEAFIAYNVYLKYQSTTKLLEDFVNEINECTSSVDKICVRSDQQVCLKLGPHTANDVPLQDHDIQKFLVKPFNLCLEEVKISKKAKKENSSPNNNLSSDFEYNDEEDKPSLLKHKKTRAKRPRNLSGKPVVTGRRGGVSKKLFAKKENRCNICNDELRTMLQLIRHHRIVHSQHYCEICSDFFDNDNLDSHLKLHGEVFCCDICKMVIRDRNDFTKHINEHQKQYICHKCGFTAKTSSILRCHMSGQHCEKGFLCKYCGKVLTGRFHFQHHVAKHEVIKKNKNMTATQALKVMEENSNNKNVRHLCSECGADFVTKRTLRTHVMRVHTGERPFHCEDCGARFVTKSLRDVHVTRRHRPARLCCPICYGPFHTAPEISKHIKRVHLKKGRRLAIKHDRITWPTTTVVPLHKLRIDVQHGLLEMFRSGELDIPHEYLNDTMYDLLKQTD